ncbi:MAG: GNAT family N-acetyltransferase [Tissierella sp.]|nr:GNAT family N-acetyltransferase [Tissierella sp.]
MNYKLKKFSELTTDELYEILKIRAEIFIVEQKCLYQDIDSRDKLAYHLFFEDHNEIVSYLRILEKGVSYHEVAIGRVVTRESHRKKGHSKELIQKAITFITDTLEETEIRLSAQLYAKKLYQSCGFRQASDIYLEDGIEHIEMLFQA